MSGRNNRRRSRPRGRGQSKFDLRPDVYEARAILSEVDFAVGILPGQYQMNQQWLQRQAEERRREAEILAMEQQRIFGGEVGDEDLVRLGLLYEAPEDHDRHTTVSNPCNSDRDDVRQEVSLPTFRTRSRSLSSDKQICFTADSSGDARAANFISTTEVDDGWDVMSTTSSGSETNRSEAWELVG